MSKTTTKLALPYPEDKDVPNSPLQVEELAKRLDLVVPKFYTPKVIASEQTRESSSYGVMGTADEIKEVVVPENGLLAIGYSAIFKSSASGTGRAAIFIGSNQLKVNGAIGPVITEIASYTAGTFWTISSFAGGLTTAGEPIEQGFVTTGMALSPGPQGGRYDGGLCYVQRLAAGTYNISVQFKATSGTVTAKERALWVMVFGNS